MVADVGLVSHHLARGENTYAAVTGTWLLLAAIVSVLMSCQVVPNDRTAGMTSKKSSKDVIKEIQHKDKLQETNQSSDNRDANQITSCDNQTQAGSELNSNGRGHNEDQQQNSVDSLCHQEQRKKCQYFGGLLHR